MSPDFQSRPPKEASAFFKAKKLQPSFDWQDVWRDEHSKAFTVARTTQIDILSDIQSALQAALDDGKTFADFKKELTPILVKKGWWGIKEQTDPQTGEIKKVRLGTPRRLQTIYWANMASARSAGQWERAQRTKAALPYFLYVQTSSADPRPEHLEWVGTILPIDHEWWHTHMTPNGWGCKCQIRQISRYEAERRGGVTKNPTIYPPQTYRRKLPNGDYEVTRVTGGIDPGWDNNPGRDRMRELRKAASRAIAKAQEAKVSDTIIKSILSGEKIATPQMQSNWLDKAINGEPIAKNDHTLPIDAISPELSQKFADLGFVVDDKIIAYDYSLLRHTWKGHGANKDKRADQIPLSKNDLLNLSNLILNGDIKTAASKQSARYRGKALPRFAVSTIFNNYKYTIILELRSKALVPVTMYKKEK